MPRWKALPEELDPRIREFTGTLRRLADRGGLDAAALADRTGYSGSAWERYLDGELPAPREAVLALAEATGTDPVHLLTLWELAERAWRRAEKRRGHTPAGGVRPAGARPAFPTVVPSPVVSGPVVPGPVVPGPAAPWPLVPDAATAPRAAARPGHPGRPGAAYGTPGGPGGPAHGTSAHRPGGAPGAPASGTPGARRPGAAPVAGPARGRGGQGGPGEGGGYGRTVLMFFAGAVGTLLVFGAAVLLYGLGGDGASGAAGGPASAGAKPAAPPAGNRAAPSLPVGVGCYRGACDGQDPHTMGCGGAYASTVASTIVGGALVEVRHSTVCEASWARVSRAAPGDTVEVTAAGATAARTARADADGDAYTPMVVVPAGTGATACATLRGGATGCTDAP
ncbi:DUF2690 domain-containing protein [Streptomyces fradiae]|uniref:helix-turn-helix domain-containing protein n=1 Tax=Streptomyces fradiae TaxID=1906 RepID=UPI0033FC5EC3